MDKDFKSHVLVVDDVETNIDILLETLGDDFDVSVAMDGEGALEIVEDKLPDLILLDIMMPGMDGYEVCKRLKSNPTTRDIPVIFLTALKDIDDEAKGLEIGAIDYITKPFNTRILIARVKTHLGEFDYSTRTIPLSALEPGMVFSENVVDDKGQILIWEGTELTEAGLESIQKVSKIRNIMQPVSVFQAPRHN